MTGHRKEDEKAAKLPACGRVEAARRGHRPWAVLDLAAQPTAHPRDVIGAQKSWIEAEMRSMDELIPAVVYRTFSKEFHGSSETRSRLYGRLR